MTNYHVGYGKPPVKNRFKRGQSGNLKGRPKGARNLRTLIAELMNARIYVTENGRRRSISTQEALLKGMLADALRGDHKARTALLALATQMLSDEGNGPPATPTRVQDSQILQRALARMQRQLTQKE
jgi:hypothetical protein